MLKYNHILRKNISMDNIFENVNFIEIENVYRYRKIANNSNIYSVNELLEDIKNNFIECNFVVINYINETRNDTRLDINYNTDNKEIIKHFTSLNNRYSAFVLELKNIGEFELTINKFDLDTKYEGYYPIEGNVGFIKGEFNVSKTF